MQKIVDVYQSFFNKPGESRGYTVLTNEREIEIRNSGLENNVELDGYDPRRFVGAGILVIEVYENIGSPFEVVHTRVVIKTTAGSLIFRLDVDYSKTGLSLNVRARE